MEVEESAELQGFDALSSLTSQPLSALIDPSLTLSAGLSEAPLLSQTDQGIIPEDSLELSNLRGRLGTRERFEALHLFGVNELSPDEVLSCFGSTTSTTDEANVNPDLITDNNEPSLSSNLRPASIEWIDDSRCNALWSSQDEAQSAFVRLTVPYNQDTLDDLLKSFQPAIPQSDPASTIDSSVLEPGELVEILHALPEPREVGMDQPETVARPLPSGAILSMPLEGPRLLHVSVSGSHVHRPPEDEMLAHEWRLLPTPFAKTPVLFVRIATHLDRKTRGAYKRSRYYAKYGNPHLGGVKGILTSHRRHQVINKLKRKHEGEEEPESGEEPPTGEMDTKTQTESLDTDSLAAEEQSLYADKRERSGDRRSVFDRLTGESPDEQTSARKKLRVRITAVESESERQSQVQTASSSRAGAAAAASSEESEWATLDRAWVNITRTRPNTVAGTGAGQDALASASASASGLELGNELTIRIENTGLSAASAQLPASTLVVDVAPPPQPAFKNLAISVPSADVEIASSVADEDFNLYHRGGRRKLASRIGESHLHSDAGDRFSSLRATARSPSPTTALRQQELRSAGRTSSGSRERFGLRLSTRSPPAHASTARDREPRDSAAGGAGVDARELIQRRRMHRDSQNLRVFIDS